MKTGNSAHTSSLLHPANVQLKKASSGGGNSGIFAAPHHLATDGIKAGYAGAVQEISRRFDVNNREMNKRRFNDQYAHIVQASKARGAKTKFRLQEVSLTLTPPDNDLSADAAGQAQADGSAQEEDNHHHPHKSSKGAAG